MESGRATDAVLRPAIAGEFQVRPPHGQRIARIQSAGQTVKATESGGVWQVRLEPHKQYTITFE